MPPLPPQIPLRLWLIAIVTGAGAFMAMLDSTVVNLAINPIRHDVGATLVNIQWVATGYLIALAVSLPLAGWLGRRFGTVFIWRMATISFVISSIACALAPDLNWLVAARCAQGLAAGLMVPAGQSVLAGCADQRQLGRLMGTVGFAVAIGPALGPGLGGYVADITSWRWLFWINIPIGLLAIFGSRFLLPTNAASKKEILDWKGLFLMSAGLPLFLFGAINLGVSELTTSARICALTGILLVFGFFRHARSRPSALINMTLFDQNGFAAACGTSALTGAAMYGGLLLLPLFLLDHLSMTITTAGLMLVVLGLGSALVLPMAGALTDRHGPRRVSAIGGILLSVSLLPLLWPGSPSLAMLVGLFFLRGIALAMAQMPAVTAAYSLISKAQKGDAAVLVNIAQRIGGAIGAIATVLALEYGDLIDPARPFLFPFILLTCFSVAAFASGLKLPPSIPVDADTGAPIARRPRGQR